MRARLKFRIRPVFNFPNRLVLPGILIGRAHDRRMWTLAFDVSQPLTDMEFVGNLQWLAAPVEQDFSPGVRFVMIDNPKQYVDGGILGVAAEGELLRG